MKTLARPNASLTDDDRYRLLLDAVTDYAIYMLDPSGIVTTWNAGAQRFKGYAPDEIVGQHFSRFYTEEDRKSGLPQRVLDSAVRSGKFEGQGWRVRKDGTRFWASVAIDPIRAPSGELLGFAKITRDLTERKAAEDSLKKSEEQFRLLVQGVTDYAIYLLDAEGHVTNWNLGAQRIKGYAPDEIVGQHFSRFYTEEDRKSGAPQRALETAIREGRYEKEGWRIRKDGTRFWANVVIDPIRREDGTLIGFAKITRDISERRETQLALEAAREALFQSQKMDAIGQLTGGVAHDFNNLLMAVLGSLELVQKRLTQDPRVSPLIDNAIQAAKRGASLTQRMLAFARRQELDAKPVNLPNLVRGMTDLLQRSLGPEVMIETRFPLSLPSVQADFNQLEMALLNLAVNARDAMPQGGSIVVSAKEENLVAGQGLKPGRYVCLAVTDSGEGMDEETLQHATEPFFTTKGVGKGTGLGLPMIHGLAEQSGGRLVLKSRKGEGTTAELWLPVATTSAIAAGEGQAAAPGSGKAMRPLVVVAVDDDPLVLMNTVEMLEELGHMVLEAPSAHHALDAIRHAEAVDLVITDQAMPHMTGLELAAAIREEWPKLPTVLATGYGELPLSANANVRMLKLNKPFSENDLAKVIAQAMDAGPAR
ncbi:MAG TPA: PAS domain S-box protein [Alphaproteobacteria bacterium]|jgi:PAS domain S-box-containing protein